VLLAGPPSALLAALQLAFERAGAKVGVEGQLPLASASGDGQSVLVEAASAALGGLDVLVRHWPVANSGPVLEASGDGWRDAIVGGLVEAFELSRAAAQAMPNGGAVVHVASIDAMHAYPGRTAAATVTAGLLGLSRSLAIELAERRVRVNVVIAGPLVELRSNDVDPATVDRTLLRSPMHRFGTTAEVASAVLFVAGPRARFMTGESLRVDGGWGSLNQAPDGMKFR